VPSPLEDSLILPHMLQNWGRMAYNPEPTDTRFDAVVPLLGALKKSPAKKRGSCRTRFLGRKPRRRQLLVFMHFGGFPWLRDRCSN
jgi:hypothetical protein